MKKTVFNFVAVYLGVYLGLILIGVIQEKVLNIPIEVGWTGLLSLSIVGALIYLLIYIAVFYVVSIKVKKVLYIPIYILFIYTIISFVVISIIGVIIKNVNYDPLIVTGLITFILLLIIHPRKLNTESK